MSLSRPPKVQTHIRRAAILFAGGPAPAANAVISTAAASFLRNDIEVIGILNGYSRLIDFNPDKPLELGRDYIMLDGRVLRRTRNSQGILIGTARSNPGRDISSPAHLNDPERINVAMSRAKDRLVIVSSSAMWRPRTATPMHRVLDEVARLAEQRLAQFVPSKELKRSLSHA